jgi:SAM-dependent methyltransferase
LKSPASAIRSLRLRAADAADRARGRRDSLTPPRRYLDFVGDSDFRATGEAFLDHFHELAGLRPEDRVLDVGCGIGRMARVLASELRPPGSYDGFDVVGEAIAWCARHYLETPAPFRFTHADLRNVQYNPGGRGSASTYRFPYGDDAFDLVIATSVFTHLLADEAANYLAEAARVLAPGGRLFATWFLLGDGPPLGSSLSGGPPPRSSPSDGSPLEPAQDTSGLAGQPARPGREAAFAFVHPVGAAFAADPAAPAAAVAYRESWLRGRLGGVGLALREPLHRGSWHGASGVSFQDIVVADAPPVVQA